MMSRLQSGVSARIWKYVQSFIHRNSNIKRLKHMLIKLVAYENRRQFNASTRLPNQRKNLI